MALTLPTSDDLQGYISGQSDDQAIQQAMDLFVLATGLSATSSALEDRLVKNAVLEMAWAIQERHFEKEEEFSNASSERIGSYSYSKAARTIANGQKTGVGAFDTAVDYFLSQALAGASSVYSEFVFTDDGFITNYEINSDPSYFFPVNPDPFVSPPPYSIDDDVNYDELPAYTTITITKLNGVWPGAPTTRADTIIVWKGAEPSPPVVQFRTLGQAGMLDNVDIRMIV